MTLPRPAPAPWTESGVRRALVYGLGISGRAAVRLLAGRGVEVVGVDDRALPAAEREALAVCGVVHAGSVLAVLPEGIDLVVLSPGVPPDRPLLEEARRRGVPIVAEVELAFPLLAGPVVAITGSNGKSTTTALTGAILEAAGLAVEVCGNIGAALSERVDGPPGRVFVVELSSFQLEALATFHARAAAYLNLAPDHLDRYPGLEAYHQAKCELPSRVDEDGVAVLNLDDPRTAAASSPGRRRFFSRLSAVEDGCYLEGDTVFEVEPGGAPRELFHRADLTLTGEHNLENAMAATLLARAMGVSREAVRRGLRGFKGLPHRMRKVSERAGVVWYNDSKGTNPAATARSLEGFPDGAVHLILGGRGKGTDFAELAPVVRRKARRLYLIGEEAAELARVLGSAAPWEMAGDLETAVRSAGARAQRGEVVLLSPACASFDQFRNFAHRGERFEKLVQDLPEDALGEEAGL